MRFTMSRLPRVAGLLLLAALGPSRLAAQAPADPEVVLATTTSVRDAGLLQEILPAFEESRGYRIKVVAVGSGQAMELGKQGEADILILHAPDQEREFVSAGFGTERHALMHNAFVVVGPGDDPAGARGLDVLASLRSIARGHVLFVSRADRSGTHVKESGLWALAGVEPDRSWYRESGQGMSATLQIANELRAYTITDIGTLLSHKYPLDLEVLVEGDLRLANPYHVVLANPERFPWLNAAGAGALRDYLLSVETQRAIGAFGRERFGRSLFEPIVR
jgi:tungstate transport system substrate-binding protein